MSFTRRLVFHHLGEGWFSTYKINMLPIASFRGTLATAIVAGLTILDSKSGIGEAARFVEIVNKTSYIPIGENMPPKVCIDLMDTHSEGPIKRAVREGYDCYNKTYDKTTTKIDIESPQFKANLLIEKEPLSEDLQKSENVSRSLGLKPKV
jgi:hypothetical protein